MFAVRPSSRHYETRLYEALACAAQTASHFANADSVDAIQAKIDALEEAKAAEAPDVHDDLIDELSEKFTELEKAKVAVKVK